MDLTKFTALLVVGGILCVLLGLFLIPEWIAIGMLLVWGVVLTAVYWNSFSRQ